MVWPALHLTCSIEAPPERVVALAGDPAQLPRWASGLAAGVREEGGRWFTDSPMGRVEVAFTGPLEAGVLDHDVTLPDGTVVHNPLRVLANGTGSEVVFTLFHRDGVSEEDFRTDAELVRSDLARLAALLEGDDELT
ncbi:Polyketide cyclase / dehydrase and lipid transport [Quadrisphaera granulorum]|uniref:Polyketide cyclase/dehydrase/lipid transport protein n=1 Tax=Quadrisphaera granulorum TaxID=317664 RepID=A0A316AG82_9ACTN|nr:SRPBCC family protein [Quadrisphaera granulorum]PWJ48827.1 polyketide cyclase/dehydrase/lipid transport protein [Quadrisphaera granulorum]SZE98309.1 Polyketide cyclase / dehydrase and lipid transport [Quadrisphaera granulorum]